jgi:hypothetical protein
METDICVPSDSDESDESAEIKNLISSFRQGLKQEGDEAAIESDTGKRKGRKKNSNNKRTTNRQKPPPKKKSLDHLKQRVSELMDIFEEHDLWIPPPNALSEKGKVWSSRIYGSDKKKQRKNTERMLVEDRIAQLETCLQEEHGLSL